MGVPQPGATQSSGRTTRNVSVVDDAQNRADVPREEWE